MPSLSAVPQKEIRNRLLGALPRRVQERVLAELEPVTLTAGQTLYSSGAPLQHVYFPQDCVMTRLCSAEEDVCMAVGLLGNEGMVEIAALSASRAPNLIVVEIGGTALRMRVGVFRKYVEESDAFRRLLMGYYGALVNQISQEAVCHCQHTLMQRLCFWLLMVRDRAGTDHLPLTHETIARRLGKRRAGITDCAGVLQRTGAISYSRGHIRIFDRRLLEASACGCYRAIKETFEHLFD